MRVDSWLARWLGPALLAIAAVATLWLAAVGRLSFYIHPRYVVFTVVVAALGLGLVVLAAALPPEVEEHPAHGHEEDGHAHEEHAGHAPGEPGATRSGAAWRWLGRLRLVLLVVVLVGLLVVPPASLTARARLSRDLVGAGPGTDTGETTVLRGGDPAMFSVKDWAGLIREGGLEAVQGQQVALSGYLLDRGEGEVFYLVRMTITCCAIDAEPVGVAVHRPGWRQEFRAGDWLEVRGGFVANPDPNGRSAAVIQPASCVRIDEPDQPYVF